MFGQGNQGGGFGQQPIGGGGLFGQPQQQQQQPSAFGGAFGQQQQKPMTFGAGQPGAFGGGGGLFGQAQQPAQGFSQPTGTGSFGGAGTSTSLFGASGGTGGFGQTQQPQGGLFGAQQPQQPNAFGQQPQTGVFGAQPQQPSQGNSLFGNQAQGFNQSPGFAQKTAFGQTAQPAGGIFGQTQAQPTMGSSGGAFGGGGTGLFGQTQMQPQQQPQQTLGLGMGGGGFFGQQQQQSQSTFGTPSQPQANLSFYTDASKYPPQIVTINQQFQPKSHIHEDKNGNWNLLLKSFRGQDQFQCITTQMARVYDTFAMQGRQQNNYEALSMQEFQQNSGKYKQDLLQQLNNLQASKQQSQSTSRSGFPSIGSTWGQKGTSSPVFGVQNPQQTQFGQGGFQQQPQQTTLSNFSAFGQQPQQPQQQTTGLFGQQQAIGTQPQSQGGLFGGQKPGGLFGQQATTPTIQPAQPAGGLFGNNPQPQINVNVGQGLFGPKPGSVGTGLFASAQAQPQAQPGGLFGQTPAQPQAQQPAQQSLFGGAAPQQPGGLFANKQPTAFPAMTQPAAQGGLFAKPAGGLFSQPAGSTTPQTGLFAQPGQQQPQTGLFTGIGNVAGQQPQQTSLFTSGQTGFQPGGLFAQASTTQFSQAQPQPGFQTQGGLFSQAGLAQVPNPLQGQTSCFPVAIQTSAASLQQYYQNQDPFDLNTGFISKATPVENFQKELEEIRKKAQAAPSLYYQPQEAIETPKSEYEWSQPNDHYNMHLAVEYEMQRQLAKQEAKRLLSQQLDESSLSRQSSMQQSVSYRQLGQSEQPSLYTKKKNEPAPKPDFSKKTLSANSVNKSAVIESPDLFNLTVVFKYPDFGEFSMQIPIHRTRSVDDIRSRVLQWMLEEFNFEENAERKLKLYFGEKELPSNETSLTEAGLSNNSKLDVVVVEKDKPESKHESKEAAKEEVRVTAADFAPKDKLPKAPKADLTIEPDMVTLTRMSLKELQAVKGLKFYNEHGSIEFQDPVDVTEVDFADVVSISKSGAEVYDENRHKGDNYPQRGQKLNMPAIITLKGIKPKQGQTGANKEQDLAKKIEKNDGEHISYDVNTATWTFKVKHFTKYGCGEEEESRDSSSNVNIEDERSEIDEKAFDHKMDIDEVSVLSNQPDIFETNIMKPIKKPLVQMISDSESQLVPKSRKMEDQNESQLINTSVFSNFDKTNQKIAYDVQKKRQELMQRIQDKQKIFDSFTPNTKKPSTAKTPQVLAVIVKDANLDLSKTSLKKGFGPRFCFHPNGDIVIANGTSLHQVKTHKATFEEVSFTDVILKNKQIVKNEEELGVQFERMAFAPVLAQKNKNALFQDFFLKELLSNNLPAFRLFTSHESPQRQLNQFLRDCAKNLAEACKHADSQAKARLNHEFYAVCMMNALFGNPMLLLHQFHSDNKGQNTLAKAEMVFSKYEQDETSLELQKMRRNALTELLKFICAQEFQPKEVIGTTDEAVYARVKEFVLNGDIKSAVTFSQKNGKTRLALLLSQSVNATQNMGLLKHYKTNFLAFQSKSLSDVFDIITGQFQPNNWQQALLSQLMFQRSPTESLKNILVNSPIFQGQQNILITLLKVFSNTLCQDELDGLRFKLTPNSDSRDYRLRWLSTLVLTNLALIKSQKGANTNCMDGNHFTDASAKYARQLLQASDWRGAIAVALLIPSQHASIMQRLVFEILSKNAKALSKQEGSDFVTDVLGLPSKWVSVASALYDQSQGKFESAFRNWKQAENFNQAHVLLYRHILPLYMTKSSGVTLLKALTQQDLTQEEKKNLILGNKICARLPKLDDHLMELEQKQALIQDWVFQGSLFMRFIKLVDSLAKNPVDNVTIQKAHIQAITELRKLIGTHFSAIQDRSSAQFIVPHFIDTQLREIETQLKIMQVQQLSKSKVGDKELNNQMMIHTTGVLKITNRSQELRQCEQLAMGILHATQKRY